MSNGDIDDFGCLKKDKLELLDFSNKFYKLIKDVFTKHDITHVITEIPVGSKSYFAVKALAFCNGMVFSTLQSYNTEIIIVQPKAAKKKVSGKANLDKDEVLEFVELKFPSIFNKIKDKPKYVRETISDCVLLYFGVVN